MITNASNSSSSGPAKKFSSLNLNKAYKPSAPADRPTSGGASRLVTVGRGRNKPQAPANAPKPYALPSLKRETKGFDPTVDYIKPGSGWASSADGDRTSSFLDNNDGRSLHGAWRRQDADDSQANGVDRDAYPSFASANRAREDAGHHRGHSGADSRTDPALPSRDQHRSGRAGSDRDYADSQDRSADAGHGTRASADMGSADRKESTRPAKVDTSASAERRDSTATGDSGPDSRPRLRSQRSGSTLLSDHDWAADAEAEMDYSKPVVFADGTAVVPKAPQSSLVRPGQSMASIVGGGRPATGGSSGQAAGSTTGVPAAGSAVAAPGPEAPARPRLPSHDEKDALFQSTFVKRAPAAPARETAPSPPLTDGNRSSGGPSPVPARKQWGQPPARPSSGYDQAVSPSPLFAVPGQQSSNQQQQQSSQGQMQPQGNALPPQDVRASRSDRDSNRSAGPTYRTLYDPNEPSEQHRRVVPSPKTRPVTSPHVSSSSLSGPVPHFTLMQRPKPAPQSASEHVTSGSSDHNRGSADSQSHPAAQHPAHGHPPAGVAAEVVHPREARRGREPKGNRAQRDPQQQQPNAQEPRGERPARREKGPKQHQPRTSPAHANQAAATPADDNAEPSLSPSPVPAARPNAWASKHSFLASSNPESPVAPHGTPSESLSHRHRDRQRVTDENRAAAPEAPPKLPLLRKEREKLQQQQQQQQQSDQKVGGDDGNPKVELVDSAVKAATSRAQPGAGSEAKGARPAKGRKGKRDAAVNDAASASAPSAAAAVVSSSPAAAAGVGPSTGRARQQYKKRHWDTSVSDAEVVAAAAAASVTVAAVTGLAPVSNSTASASSSATADSTTPRPATQSSTAPAPAGTVSKPNQTGATAASSTPSEAVGSRSAVTETQSTTNAPVAHVPTRPVESAQSAAPTASVPSTSVSTVDGWPAVPLSPPGVGGGTAGGGFTVPAMSSVDGGMIGLPAQVPPSYAAMHQQQFQQQQQTHAALQQAYYSMGLPYPNVFANAMPNGLQGPASGNQAPMQLFLPYGMPYPTHPQQQQQQVMMQSNGVPYLQAIPQQGMYGVVRPGPAAQPLWRGASGGTSGQMPMQAQQHPHQHHLQPQQQQTGAQLPFMSMQALPPANPASAFMNLSMLSQFGVPLMVQPQSQGGSGTTAAVPSQSLAMLSPGMTMPTTNSAASYARQPVMPGGSQGTATVSSVPMALAVPNRVASPPPPVVSQPVSASSSAAAAAPSWAIGRPSGMPPSIPVPPIQSQARGAFASPSQPAAPSVAWGSPAVPQAVAFSPSQPHQAHAAHARASSPPASSARAVGSGAAAPAVGTPSQRAQGSGTAPSPVPNARPTGSPVPTAVQGRAQSPVTQAGNQAAGTPSTATLPPRGDSARRPRGERKERKPPAASAHSASPAQPTGAAASAGTGAAPLSTPPPRGDRPPRKPRKVASAQEQRGPATASSSPPPAYRPASSDAKVEHKDVSTADTAQQRAEAKQRPQRPDRPIYRRKGDTPAAAAGGSQGGAATSSPAEMPASGSTAAVQSSPAPAAGTPDGRRPKRGGGAAGSGSASSARGRPRRGAERGGSSAGSSGQMKYVPKQGGAAASPAQPSTDAARES